jgi:hypothetical protein
MQLISKDKYTKIFSQKSFKEGLMVKDMENEKIFKTFIKCVELYLEKQENPPSTLSTDTIKNMRIQFLAEYKQHIKSKESTSFIDLFAFSGNKLVKTDDNRFIFITDEEIIKQNDKSNELTQINQQQPSQLSTSSIAVENTPVHQVVMNRQELKEDSIENENLQSTILSQPSQITTSSIDNEITITNNDVTGSQVSDQDIHLSVSTPQDLNSSQISEQAQEQNLSLQSDQDVNLSVSTPHEEEVTQPSQPSQPEYQMTGITPQIENENQFIQQNPISEPPVWTITAPHYQEEIPIIQPVLLQSVQIKETTQDISQLIKAQQYLYLPNTQNEQLPSRKNIINTSQIVQQNNSQNRMILRQHEEEYHYEENETDSEDDNAKKSKKNLKDLT